MPFVILLIIASLWALYLVPLWLRSRGSGGRSSSRISGGRRGSGPVVLFSGASSGSGRSMSLTGGMAALSSAPRTAAEARRRRRDVLIGLGAVAVLTLLLALALGGPFWVFHVLVDIALVGFGYLVHEHEDRARERADKVRPLPVERRAPRAATEATELRRRAAN